MRKNKNLVFNELISERNAKMNKSHIGKNVLSAVSMVFIVGIFMSAIIVLPSVLPRKTDVASGTEAVISRESGSTEDSEINTDTVNTSFEEKNIIDGMDSATLRSFAKNYNKIVWADYSESDLVGFNRLTYKDVSCTADSYIPCYIDQGFIVDETDELYACVLVPYVVTDNTVATIELKVDGEDLQLSVSGENLKRIYLHPMLVAKGIKYFEVNGVTVALLTATELNDFYEKGMFFQTYEDYLYAEYDLQVPHMMSNVNFNIFLDKAPYDLNPFYDPEPFRAYYVFNGKIVDDTTFLVESTEENDIMMPKGTETYIEKKIIDTYGIEKDLGVGDNICVVYKGLVMESYPVQINTVYAFYIDDKIDVKGQNYSDCSHNWKLVKSRDKPYYREYVCTKCGMGKIEME